MAQPAEEVAEVRRRRGRGRGGGRAALAGVVGLVVGTRRRVGVAGGVGVEDGMDWECRWLLIDGGGGERGGRLRGRRRQPALEVGKDVGGQLIRRQLRRGGASVCVVAGDEGLRPTKGRAGIDTLLLLLLFLLLLLLLDLLLDEQPCLGLLARRAAGGRADGR